MINLTLQHYKGILNVPRAADSRSKIYGHVALTVEPPGVSSPVSPFPPSQSRTIGGGLAGVGIPIEGVGTGAVAVTVEALVMKAELEQRCAARMVLRRGPTGSKVPKNF
jgi:hypothetical protein